MPLQIRPAEASAHALSMPDWQRLAWEKHHQQCKRSRLSDIHLYGKGIPVSSKTIDFLLDDSFTQHESPGFGQEHPSIQRAQPRPVSSEEHHDLPSPSANRIPDTDEEKDSKKAKSDESAFATAEKIIAGQCICCNTVFQLEIMEKVGTIDNVDVEIRKLQQGGQARMRESYGSMASAGADYTPRDNRESRITYDAAPSSSSYDVPGSSGEYK